MFEPATSDFWHSCFLKHGAHYNVFSAERGKEMDALRFMFKDAKADEYNLCLFSTSGVHGTYGTIEEAEAEMLRGNLNEDGEPTTPEVTFLVIHPKIVCLRYGNCQPKTAEDIVFLKQLRESSWVALQTIGRAEL